MRRLSALDAQFLNVEDRTTTGHVGSVVVLDPSTAPGGVVDLDTIRDVLEPRLHLADPFRQRLVDVPLGLGYPYWADDPDFDLEYHLREVGLPRPGTPQELGEQVARIHARPLDRTRPLWELYVVSGLADGRVALYSKVHHAAIDTLTGAEVLAALMDTTPEPRDVLPDEWDPEPVPPSWQLLPMALASATGRAREVVTGLPRALPYLTSLPAVRELPGARVVQEAAGLLTALAGRPAAPGRRGLVAPRTPFNGPITAHRRFAYTSLPLADLRRVRDAAGVSVNDVVLALVAGVLRHWLLDHDALPGAPLVAAVPLSVRDEPGPADADADEAVAGSVQLMVVALPTQLADASARLAAVAADSATAREELDALPATILQDVSALVPTALSGLAARALFRLVTAPGSLVNLFVSNVPGPRSALYVAGARVEGVYPVSAVTDMTGGLSVAVYGHGDSVDVGFVVCREMVPDVWRLPELLHAELAALLPD